MFTSLQTFCQTYAFYVAIGYAVITPACNSLMKLMAPNYSKFSGEVLNISFKTKACFSLSAAVMGFVFAYLLPTFTVIFMIGFVLLSAMAFPTIRKFDRMFAKHVIFV